MNNFTETIYNRIISNPLWIPITEFNIDDTPPIKDFELYDSNAYKIGYSDKTTNLIIPETFVDTDGTKYRITEIGDAAFTRNTNLQSVTIPSSVKLIWQSAFRESSIKSINILNGVTKIYNCAFMDCTNLITVNIPDSVTSIGEYLFYDCTALKSITIPGSLEVISTNAFCRCSGLTNVIIQNGVKIIMGWALAGLTKLTSLKIPDSVTQIRQSAFADCKSLDLTIPNSVTYIEKNAFYNVPHITYHGPVTGGMPWGALSIN